MAEPLLQNRVAVVTGAGQGIGREIARSLGAHGATVVRTPMTAAMPPEIFAEQEAAVPMKRAGEPAEVAGAVVFLGSELSSYITGSVIEVGGGRYI